MDFETIKESQMNPDQLLDQLSRHIKKHEAHNNEEASKY